jgi:hypothetical protein
MSAGRFDRDLGVVIGCLWENQAVCEMVADCQGYLEYISMGCGCCLGSSTRTDLHLRCPRVPRLDVSPGWVYWRRHLLCVSQIFLYIIRLT